MENKWLEMQPPRASNWADSVDLMFYVITALTVVFTILVAIMLFYSIIKYRRGKVADRSNPVHDHQVVEALWTGLPLILALGIFFWSTAVYVKMRNMPDHAYEAFVIGKQWMWHVQHPNGIRENNELTVPIGQPVKLTMISQDVIHAFYIPAFRMQYHVIPGRYTSMWFTPTKTGEFHLFCNMLCGVQHSEMIGKVNVLSPAEFAKWMEKAGNRFRPTASTVAEKGKQLYDDMKCGTCHVDRDIENGPTLYGIFGATRATNVGNVVADEDYLRESLINPYNKLTKGYGNTMPVYKYKEAINEEQIRQLIEYMKTLGAAPGAQR